MLGVEKSEALGLWCTLTVGSYGGGDAFRAAPQLLVVDLTSHEVLGRLALLGRPLKEVVWAEVVREHAHHVLVQPDQRIVRLPPTLPPEGAAGLQWQLRVQVSQRLPGSADHYNLFYQGWLFANDVLEEGRQGVSRWPLIGLFAPKNLARPPGEEDVAHVGIDRLKPADQHTHLVQETLDLDGFQLELKDWHMGSDMAQFVVVEEARDVSVAWAVCVDLDKLRCEVTLLFLVSASRGSRYAPP
ncbi:uncharacterized protein ACA1_383540 [Acanthamoeba castellanii str. Neff]|uniref:Uncharacterized protein n=1 Tax=Acanthamoeba castellanii (strain ATCC 30010 / Neff) TaxID=1257118 RepID=L8GV55_ACACF|nr:uncharacterized protein ACA1_383540 [Acanthamoeba castellanii str. Neff]ELR16822.1 hypothetical protein ACA1_383540 [Acanthamoeba castellanii str. Neff]